MKPDLGLHEPPEADPAELRESYRTKNWYPDQLPSQMFASTKLFNDCKVDALRRQKFLSRHQFLVRFTEPKSQKLLLSRKDFCVLFPRKIFGFVLRSRRWGEYPVYLHWTLN